MKIYYEDSMPYGQEFFADLGECEAFSHKTITPALIADADVLLTRSTTKVTPALLSQANKLKFVGTATAGTDHVDKYYLQTQGIPFVSAGGCNAVAVAEYVLSTLFVLANKYNWQVQNQTVGIVGAGHVGTALAKHLSALGIEYKLCDPPLQEAGDSRNLVSMEEIMQCDVISLHVPWIKEGPHPTESMFDANRLAQLSGQQVLINACRGEVLDNDAALALLQKGKGFKLVLDVWDNEPNINLDLIPFTELATAHIAGHTIEGKARGTEMLYTALCQQLGVQASKVLSNYLPIAEPSSINLHKSQDDWSSLSDLVLDVYNIAKDDAQFKKLVNSGEQFRYIRKHYPIRREFSAIKVNTGNFVHSKAIYDLGFLC
ncbi:4-phosphoerythronate dehydrogenase [Paraglaciecola aquimarina]|uniref:Erythronate-4-phosphate dehydrogenase n=1 Tax=Paraglaciecola algarum TaxID=3050085 RepID=A0ABS9D843_9ALTE|nr:4-phosphoerythronate dehydrogenase [Paraglaciecola sp. G1-23]MCF2948540.1 4-phosphoerythronate dehydrogenase [Paraglaciecola sp. G1-23]